MIDFFAKRPASGTNKKQNGTQNTGEQDLPRKQSLYFKELCSVFEQIEGTTKRLQITAYLTEFFGNLFKEQQMDDIVATCLLALSRLGPEYEGLELGLGEALLLKALSQSTGRSSAVIKQEMEQIGDIGKVAMNARSAQKVMFPARPLTLQSLLGALRDIARAQGMNASLQRVSKVQGLLVACDPLEAKYLFRLLAGKMRIGLAEQSVLIALAEAANQCPTCPHATLADPGLLLKSVFHCCPNYTLVVPALLKYGLTKELEEHCAMTPGVPVKPMLAFPTKSMTEVLDRFEGVPFTCEFKYDGERAQIHRLPSGEFMIFSRNQENMTVKYPDIITEILPVCLQDMCDFVIDAEVVAWDPVNKKLLPFQVLSTRKRKDVTVESVQVQVCLFAFDLLYYQGCSYLKQPLSARRSKLHSLFREVPGRFEFARSLDTESIDEMQGFLEESITGSCEGLMVKVREGPESSYEPSKRSRNWLKVKKDYLAGNGLGDSLDLVVVGAYWGRGKRTGGFGGFLLACYDPEQEEYQVICKIGTGFSETDLESFSKILKDLQTQKPSYVKGTDSVQPDLWFEPKIVWEVRAADFSLSPIYSAAVGLVDPARGISLRFPRFIRVRDDKQPEDATNGEQIAEMYRQQSTYSTDVADDIEDYY